MSKLFTIDELEHELRSLQARIDNDALNFIPGISENVSGLGAPSAGDLRKVNKLLPKGAEPLTADAITVVPIMAADNLINSYFYRFDPAALGQIWAPCSRLTMTGMIVVCLWVASLTAVC